MKNVKLFGAVLGVALIAGCTGTGLPSGTTPTGVPGFNVRITKNSTPVANKTVFLKKFNGGEAGTFKGTSESLKSSTAKTDSNGNAFLPAPADAVAAGGLFGVGYDAGDEKAENKDASKLTDEIQWFTTPAMNLSTSSTKTANVNIDLAWAISGFQPATGAPVSGSTVNFTLPMRSDATEYEVFVNQGSVAGSGTKAFNEKSTKNTFTWTNAAPGTYNYTGKFFTSAGMGGLQASSPVLVFTVGGAQ